MSSRRQRIAKLLRQLATEVERDDEPEEDAPRPSLTEDAERAADAVMRRYDLHLEP